jgi:hypothetical protein
MVAVGAVAKTVRWRVDLQLAVILIIVGVS